MSFLKLSESFVLVLKKVKKACKNFGLINKWLILQNTNGEEFFQQSLIFQPMNVIFLIFWRRLKLIRWRSPLLTQPRLYRSLAAWVLIGGHAFSQIEATLVSMPNFPYVKGVSHFLFSFYMALWSTRKDLNK